MSEHREQFDNLSHLWHRCRRMKRGAFSGEVWVSVYCPEKKFGFRQIKMSGCWQVMARVGGYELLRREIDENNHHRWISIAFDNGNYKMNQFICAAGEIISLSDYEQKITSRKKAS